MFFIGGGIFCFVVFLIANHYIYKILENGIGTFHNKRSFDGLSQIILPAYLCLYSKGFFKMLKYQGLFQLIHTNTVNEF